MLSDAEGRWHFNEQSVIHPNLDMGRQGEMNKRVGIDLNSGSGICRLVATSLLLLVTALGSGGADAQKSAEPKVMPSTGAGQGVEAFGGYGGLAAIPEPVLPSGVDVFNLTLDETKLYCAA